MKSDPCACPRASLYKEDKRVQVWEWVYELLWNHLFVVQAFDYVHLNSVPRERKNNSNGVPRGDFASSSQYQAT